jgi:hypothetical protein
LKTHLQNGSIYFSGVSFTQKINIFEEIIAERYDHRFSSPKLQFSLLFGLFGFIQEEYL